MFVWKADPKDFLWKKDPFGWHIPAECMWVYVSIHEALYPQSKQQWHDHIEDATFCGHPQQGISTWMQYLPQTSKHTVKKPTDGSNLFFSSIL